MKPRHSILLVSCWIAAAPTFADTPLFRPAEPTAQTELPGRLPEKMLRDNVVSLDASRVVNAGRGAPELTLELFPDVTLRATLNRVETHGAKTFHWHGRAVDDFASMVVLTVADDRLFGSVVYHGRRYAIAWLPSGNYQVSEVDLDALPPDHSLDDRGAAPVMLKGDGPRPGFRFGKFIPDVDIMVLWSNEVEHLDACVMYMELVLGGLPFNCIQFMISHPEVDWKAIMTDILVPHAIAEANFVFANSGLGTPLNLVHAQSAAYAGSGNLKQDRDRLAGKMDGYLDLVHAVRDARKADLVMLVTYHSDYSQCGNAQGPGSIDPSNSDIAFGAVSAECFLNGNFTFVHELGHLFGPQHDWYVFLDPQYATGMPPRIYAHGYTRMPEGQRTIMAYPNECQDKGGWLCLRMPFFSDGAAWGRPETDPRPANNVKMISEALWTIATYR